MAMTDKMKGFLWVLPIIATGVVVFADNNPATDEVKRLIGYQGTLELDGAALSGPMTLELALYPSDSATTPIYRQCFTPTLAAGRFNVVLGPSGLNPSITDCTGTPSINLATVVNDANDLHVGITIIDQQRGRIPLEGKQRVLPVPYTFWSSESANFKVNQDLTVARNAVVSGSLTAGPTTVSGALAAGATTVTGNATVTGTTTTTNLTVNNTLEANVIRAGDYTPNFANWNQSPSGQGGACILNDNVGYKELMIAGNTTADGTRRRVGIWDDLTVHGNNLVGGNLTVSGRHLPDYDSTWLWVDNSAHQEKPFPHNFDALPSRVLLQICGALNSTTGRCTTRVLMVSEEGYRNGSEYVNPAAITVDYNNVYVHIIQGYWMYGYWGTGGFNCYGDCTLSDAYYRVLAWR